MEPDQARLFHQHEFSSQEMSDDDDDESDWCSSDDDDGDDDDGDDDDDSLNEDEVADILNQLTALNARRARSA